MKRLFVAGNWKMNKTHSEAVEFINHLQNLKDCKSNIIIAPPSLYACEMHAINKKSFIHLALQNCNQHNHGAYTGELSAEMIASVTIPYCIVGHSERRQYYGETDEVIAEKVKILLAHQVQPILCIGETLEERKSNKTLEIVTHQLDIALKGVTKDAIHNMLIAYEPIWAIGTGVSASTQEAEEVHLALFNYLSQKYSIEIASSIPLLYGGSCNDKNAEELFSQPNIWGGLIGGASLNIDTFKTIIQIAEELLKNVE